MKKSKRNPEKTPAGQAKAAVAAPRPGPKPWHYAVAALAAFLVALQAYQPALRGPFVYDDIYLPYNAPELADKSLFAWMRGVRPLLMLSFWLNFRLSGLEPFSYHFLNFLLHFGCGVLVFLIARRILTQAGAKGWTREGFSFFGALVFLLHPLQTESVSYIASRSECLSVFFFYAAFALFLYRKREAISWPVAAGVLALFGAAVSTKEHAAVLPALLLLTDYFWNPGFSLQGIRRNWRLYVPIALGGVLAIRYVLSVLRHADTAGFNLKQLTWYEYFYTQCRAIWVYLRMFLFPYGQSIDHDFAISKTLLDRGAIVALLALAGLVALAIAYRRKFPVASYGFLSFVLLIAPTSSIVPIIDPLVEHRLYMPMIGLVLVCCGLLMHWRVKRSRLTAALGGVLLIAAVLTYNRNQVWGNSIALWENAVAESPEKARPHFQLAYANFLAGRCDVALQQYQRVADLSKPDVRLLVDWALAYDCANKPEPALEKLRQAAAIQKTGHIYATMGMIYGKRGQRDQALQVLDEAVKLDPNFEMAYVYRGNVHVTSNEFEAAANDFRRALEINPESDSARSGLRLAEARLKPTR